MRPEQNAPSFCLENASCLSVYVVLNGHSSSYSIKHVKGTKLNLILSRLCTRTLKK